MLVHQCSGELLLVDWLVVLVLVHQCPGELVLVDWLVVEPGLL